MMCLRLRMSASIGSLIFGLLHLQCSSDQKETDSTRTQSSSGTSTIGDENLESTRQVSSDRTAAVANAQDYFTLMVKPALERQCSTCHADPRNVTEIAAPLTIFNYSQMKSWIQSGSSPTSNEVADRLLGQLDHTGGQRCASPASSPCDVLTRWAEIERGEVSTTTPNAPASTSFGALTSADAFGKMIGWAINPSSPTEVVDIAVYLDGDKESGTLLLQAKADRAGPDGNTPGNHQFIIELPEQIRDQNPRRLWLYAITRSGSGLIAGDFEFTGYKFSVAGRAFFEQTVLDVALTSCGSCHTPTYEGFFANLIRPAPHDGGSRVDNDLIDKATLDGVSHGGGRRCASDSTSLCQHLQTWWNLEFNP